METEDLRNYALEIGARIKAFRLAKGMTQVDVAQDLGERLGSKVPQSRIGNYEQGTRIASALDMVLLAEVLGVTAGAIYGFEAQLADKEQELIDLYRAAGSAGKRAILEAAREQ